MKNLFTLLFIFVMSSLIAEDITTRLSRNKMSMNESFTVEFISTKRLQGEPDFSPLEEDFDILSVSSGFQTTIINGHFSEAMNWNLSLMPKREGALTLPAIRFGQAHSLPETIEVVKGEAPKKEDALYLTTEISPAGKMYEQMPVIYTVRLFSSYAALHGVLSELKTSDPDAIIKQFGPDKQYEVFDQTGKRRLVVERQYSVIPQHSGEITFYPIIFEGSIQAVPAFFNVQTNIKRIYSNQEIAEVKPIPAAFQDHPWLPAYAVSLKEEWSKDPNSLEVGEPITWTVTLTADGNFASQLPDLQLNLDKSLKLYPDKPEPSNEVTPNGFLGVKQVKFALIPQKPGEYTLPEIKILWWDIKEEVTKEALLEARKIRVIDPIAMVDVPVKAAEVIHEEKVTLEAPSFSYRFIGFILVAVIVLSLFLFLLKKRTKNPLKLARKAFKKACVAGQAKEAEYYFLYLMGKNFPHLKPLNLMSIKPYLTDDLRQAVDALYHSLYGEKREWNGKLLLKAFYRFKVKKVREAKVKPLFRELYPS